MYQSKSSSILHSANNLSEHSSSTPRRHGGDLEGASRRLGCDVTQLLDASTSLAPMALPLRARWAACRAPLRPYPDRSALRLSTRIATLHGLEATVVLPGNGAAELFTWAARDAAALGCSSYLQPCFADYERALKCWGGSIQPTLLPLDWRSSTPVSPPPMPSGPVLWITNPHNPTGQLWSRVGLELALQQHQLVVCDEAFLPLVPDGERQSLIPLVAKYPNLVVIRSLTKLYGIAGLRIGYAVAQPQRLQRWASWRDPWPINAVASAVAQELLRHPTRYHAWCRRVQRWTAREGAWLRAQLAAIPGLTPMPSAANFLLIRSDRSLVPLREALEHRHRILLRDCRSFDGLDERWLRLGYQGRRNNRRIISAIQKEWR